MFILSNLCIFHKQDLPYISIGDDHSIGVDLVMINTLSKYFNFSYEMIDCQGHYGTVKPNGTWTGMMGKLAQNVWTII